MRTSGVDLMIPSTHSQEVFQVVVTGSFPTCWYRGKESCLFNVRFVEGVAAYGHEYKLNLYEVDGGDNDGDYIATGHAVVVDSPLLPELPEFLGRVTF